MREVKSIEFRKLKKAGRDVSQIVVIKINIAYLKCGQNEVTINTVTYTQYKVQLLQIGISFIPSPFHGFQRSGSSARKLNTASESFNNEIFLAQT